MAVRKLKDGRWSVYYRIKTDSGESKIKWEYFGRGAEGEARARARHEELNLLKRRPPNLHYGPSFGELARLYTRDRRFSPNSEKHLLIRLSANILLAFGNLPAIKISESKLNDYVDARLKSVKRSTVRRELTDIIAILNWATRKKLIAYNPVALFKKPAPDDEIIAPPTVKEVNSLLKHATGHLRRVILLSMYTGVRVGRSELFKIRWIDVDFDLGIIEVQSAHKGGPVRRRVPIHPELGLLLKEWRLADDPATETVIHYLGRPVKSVRKAWATALESAKISRRLRPYDLRHWNVTTALENGADVKTLSQIVGSRPETLIKYYQHVSREMHRLTVEKIPKIGPGYTRKYSQNYDVIKLEKRKVIK